MHCSEMTGDEIIECVFFATNACFLVFANAAPSIGTAVVHGFSDFSAAPLRRAGRLLPLFPRRVYDAAFF